MSNNSYVNLYLPFILAVAGVADVYAKSSDIDQSVLATDDLKPRIVVLTDIAPGDCEPDDMESVVRLLSHADLFEVEAIVTGSGWNSGGGAYSDEWASYLHTVFRHEVSPDSVTACFTNMRPEIKEISQKYEKYFYPAIFNNFAAKMDWAANGVGNRNPELVINGIGGLSPIEIKVSSGESVKLDISGSSDPDGDGLEYKWWIMPEAGISIPEHCLTVDSSGNAEILLPEDLDKGDVHIICECTDSGSIPLTSYRRIILKVI